MRRIAYAFFFNPGRRWGSQADCRLLGGRDLNFVRQKDEGNESDAWFKRRNCQREEGGKLCSGSDSLQKEPKKQSRFHGWFYMSLAVVWLLFSSGYSPSYCKLRLSSALRKPCGSRS